MNQVAVNSDNLRPKLSAFVVTFNEEKNIRECLESVAFCDEVVVVDSHSTDKTRDIARAFGARVIERPWVGYRAQKQFASEQCSNEWVLLLDADERVSPTLREQISNALETADSEVGFEVSRVNYFFGKWWRKGGWYPEYRLRLFRKSAVAWGGRDPHERVVPSGKVGKLDGEILHYSFDDLQDQLTRLIKYARINADEIVQSGERVGLRHIALSPLIRFFKFYFVKFGFREGMPGLIVAVNEGFYSFLKYALAWELQNRRRRER